MKKFSKIFVALLMLALVVSSMSVMSLASTNTTGSARLNVTGDPYNFYNDFSEGKNGSTYGATGQNDGTHIKGVKMDYKGGYFRAFNDPGAAVNATYAIPSWFITKWGNKVNNYKGSNLLDTSYAVLDLEFGTDRYWYSYEEGGATKYATTKSLDNVGVDIIDSGIAYAKGNYLCFYLQVHEKGSTKYDSRKYDGYLYLVQDEDGVWYASADTVYDPSDVMIANEINKSNHVSVIFDSVTKDGSVMFHVYVNGEYLYSKTLSYTTAKHDAVSFRGAGINIPGTEKKLDKYSVFMDNIAINWYRTGAKLDTSGVTTEWSPYASAADVYGVDDLLVDLANGEKNPIYNCDDVLYRGDYYSPNGAVYVENEGESYRTSIPGLIDDVLANVKNGSVIKAEIDVYDFEVPEGVEKLTLKYDKSKSVFTFSESFNDKYICIPDADGKTYTIRTLQESDKIAFKYSLDGAVIKNTSLVLNKMPETNIEFMKLNVLESKLSVATVSSWKFDIDGSYENAPLINLYDEEDIRSISYLEVQLINEEFGGQLTANAKSEGIEFEDADFSGYAYLAGYIVNGELYVISDSTGSFAQYENIETLEAESANWDADVKCFKIESGVVSEYDWNASENVEQNSITQLALWHSGQFLDSVSTLQFTENQLQSSVAENGVFGQGTLVTTQATQLGKILTN